MKQLSIEEKAKAYDEAKLRMSAAYNSNRCTIGFMNEIFPELRESEDEKIRKELLNHLKEASYGKTLVVSTLDYKRWADWLEKQGKNNIGISEATKQKLENNLNKALEKETPESLNKFLDEQGEQKPIEEYNITGIGSKNAQGKLGEMIKNLKPVNEVLEQKPADKFKVKKGEWYVCTNTFVLNGKIIAIKGQIYQSKQEDNTITCEDNCLFIDRHDGKASEYFRPWTIQDAKEGDVLCCESGWTCIFKALNNHTNTFSSYCFMDCDKWFYNTGSECHTLDKAFIKAYNGEIYPATKEQRDLLFQKMKKAGYEWDAEKKELKKVEQKSWSEEDEKYLKLAIENFQMLGNSFLTSWLKSLKDRVLSQPKKEWSKEDKNMHDFALRAIRLCKQYAINNQINGYSKLPDTPQKYEELYQWLKERYTWKPSDEQMYYLSWIANVKLGDSVVEQEVSKHLNELYTELKKLKEE